MTVNEIARDFTALCAAGKFEEAGEKYWAADVVSIEAAPQAPEARGKDALKAKGDAWTADTELHSFSVGGPYVCGAQFVVRFTIDRTAKSTGQRIKADEVGLYTLKNGKIVEERFFYAG